jgi:hypothetical protein
MEVMDMSSVIPILVVVGTFAGVGFIVLREAKKQTRKKDT